MTSFPTPCITSPTRVFVLAAIVLLFDIPFFAQSVPGALGKNGSGMVVVQSDKAEENLINSTSPVYPALAKQAQVQGIVRLRAVISKTGTVVSVTYLSGPAMLVQAAIDAVKQWKYKPFVVEGQPADVVAEIEVPFFLGVSDAEMKVYRERHREFKVHEDECRALLEADKYGEAEVSCLPLLALAAKLPKAQYVDQIAANDLYGEALLFQKKFPEALGYLKRALEIGESSYGSENPELAYLYHHAAWGYQGVGDMKKARSCYEKAETTLRKARDHAIGDEFKNLYAKRLQAVLADYINLLRQIGQQDAADKAQLRADAIAKEIHP